MTKTLRYFTLATILVVVGCFTYQNVQDYKESFAKCGTPEMVEQEENVTSSTDNSSVPESQVPIGGINFGHSETYPTEEGVNVTTTQNEGVNMSNAKTYPSSTGYYTIGNFQSTAIFQTEARPGDGQPMELEDVTTCFNYPYVDIGTEFRVVHGWHPKVSTTGKFRGDIDRVSYPVWKSCTWAHTESEIVRFMEIYPEGWKKTLIFGHWHARQLRERWYDGNPDEDAIWYDRTHKLIGIDPCSYISKRVNVLVIEDERILNNSLN